MKKRQPGVLAALQSDGQSLMKEKQSGSLEAHQSDGCALLKMFSQSICLVLR